MASRCTNQDLLPLPYVPPIEPPSQHISRSVQQRVFRRRAVVVEANKSIAAVNSLAGFEAPPQKAVSASQRVAQEHFLAVHAGAPRAQLTRDDTKEAIDALLGRPVAYDSDGSTTVRNYQRDLLSIPCIGAQAVDLQGLLPDSVRKFLVDPQKMLNAC